jgi:hypothetical protein
MSSKLYTQGLRANNPAGDGAGAPGPGNSQPLEGSAYSLYKWLKDVDKTLRLTVKEDLRVENAHLKAELSRV